MNKLPGYGKVYAFGHRAVADILTGPVVVEEKVDGSQFSFGFVDGKLKMRSRRVEVFEDAGDKIFWPAIEHLKTIGSCLREDYNGWVFRCEAVCRPKHNTVAYKRRPAGCLVLLNADETGQCGFVDRIKAACAAADLGIELVPELIRGQLSLEAIREQMSRPSFLGADMEGVVIKPLGLDRFTEDGKLMMAKIVSEAFKERHSDDYARRNPKRAEVVQDIIEALKTEARFNKAVQHLRDDGRLQGGPEDIGPLIRELHIDIEAEESDYIKQRLFKHFVKEIKRGVGKALPSWYKEKLAAGEIEC